MAPPLQKLRGFRHGIPGGFVIGRLGSGRGHPQLLPISPDGGIRINPGNPSGGTTGGNGSSAGALLAALDTISSTHGAILFRAATAWDDLPPGTAKYFLRTAGTGADPAWISSAYDIALFLTGTPAISSLLWQFVAARAFTLADDFSGSRAYFNTAPSGGSVVLDVKRNGGSIGSITFGSGSNTATFSTTGSGVESFSAGDRLSVHSPSDMRSSSDLSVTFNGVRND
jgi:hypothetical protein